MTSPTAPGHADDPGEAALTHRRYVSHGDEHYAGVIY
jgi:hypothetical protein